jgi:hypothetical protein
MFYCRLAHFLRQHFLKASSKKSSFCPHLLASLGVGVGGTSNAEGGGLSGLVVTCRHDALQERSLDDDTFLDSLMKKIRGRTNSP